MSAITNNSPVGDAGTSLLHRNAIRMFGYGCLGGQLMILAKGLAAYDPLLVTSGAIGATAQIGNIICNDRAKSVTFPTLVLSAALAGAAGIHSGLATGLHAGNVETMAFGGIKTAGLAVTFWGCRNPAMRVLRALHPERIGEVMVGIATTALAANGVQQLIEGLSGEPGKTLSGSVTVLASMGFYFGLHYAAIAQKYERLGLSRPGANIPAGYACE